MSEYTDDNQVFAQQTDFIFPQYLSVTTADQYFYQRLNSDAWLNASEADKNASLVQSTRAIDLLNFVGVKCHPDQILEFPRWQPRMSDEQLLYQNRAAWLHYQDEPVQQTVPRKNPGIPQDILIACCENAVVLLGGFDFEMELSLLNTQATNYGAVRETYDRTLVETHLRSGIASGLAWQRLKPWLADTQSFTFSRVN